MSTVTIPILETDRLVLRAPRLEDVAPEAAFYATERSQFVGGPQSREQVWRNMAMLLGHWSFRGYGFWGVDEKATGVNFGKVGRRYTGHVGLRYPEGWPEPEVGWTVMENAEGKGYAFEAALAARAYAYDTLGWETAISLIAPANNRSIALAERLGARFEAKFDHERFGETLIYRHPAAEG